MYRKGSRFFYSSLVNGERRCLDLASSGVQQHEKAIC